jgi:hypothetical protein
MLTRNAPSRLKALSYPLMQWLLLISRLQQFARLKLGRDRDKWIVVTQPWHLAVLIFTFIALCHEAGWAQNSPTIDVSPKSLVFAAEQGGANPADQTLNVSSTAGEDLTWTASKTAHWLTLRPITGNKADPVTATVTTGTLPTGTYKDEIIVSVAGTQVAKTPVTFSVASPKGAGPPAPPIPPSANSSWRDICVDKSLNLPGDFQTGLFGLQAGQWSVGPSVSTQLIKFDLAKERAGFNTSVGVGASFRYYRGITIKDADGAPIKDKAGKPENITISQIRQECRQTTFKARSEKSYLAAPLFSITPTLYVTKPTSQGDLEVQPAILFGFFEDILNFGVGWNLTGPPGEKGNVFLLMSIGAGFNF